MSAALRDKWLKEFNAGGDGATFKYVSSDTAFCRACEKTFRAKQKSELAQHVRGDRHKSNLALKKKRTVTQATMEDFGGGKRHKCDVVAHELCQAMLAAGIPWSKLENPALRSFLEKHITLQIPDESWIRKHYLDKCYDEALAGICADLGQQPIWLSVDEMTDSAGRYVANIIAGRLSKEGYFRPHLVQCMFLEKTNSGEIVRAVNDTLRYLWPDFKPECLKVLVSDAAAYMIKAGHALKELFPDLLHVTCVAHALHRVCETVREMFKDVNALIATTKKIPGAKGKVKSTLAQLLRDAGCSGIALMKEDQHLKKFSKILLIDNMIKGSCHHTDDLASLLRLCASDFTLHLLHLQPTLLI
uniref:uncharacterized protein n=1 Tax=Myxine glutinosa TaxID=7769 RepID=UPI00358E8181